jgi:putative oxidoreductase
LAAIFAKPVEPGPHPEDVSRWFVRWLPSGWTTPRPAHEDATTFVRRPDPAAGFDGGDPMGSQARSPDDRTAMKPLVTKTLAAFHAIEPALQAVVLLLLRVVIGWQFFLTGKGKLTHLDKTAGFYESLGLPAPGFHAGLVGGVEMIGGLLLLVGLASRVAALPLTITMIVAYLTAHHADAFKSVGAFIEQPPFPFLIVCLIVLAVGAGRISLDHFLCRKGCCRSGD